MKVADYYYGEYVPPYEFNDLDFEEYAEPNPRYVFQTFKNYPSIVDTIQECEAICERMTEIIKRRPDANLRTRQLLSLRDCADICGLAAKFIARQSKYSKSIAYLCGVICKDCGEECARHPDRESQNCAKICLVCAKDCFEFARIN